jgi:hypothetical protein
MKKQENPNDHVYFVTAKHMTMGRRQIEKRDFFSIIDW